MNIAVIGCGYVGLVTAACLAEMGHQVIGIDTDSKKINSLKKGLSPIFESGLETLVTQNLNRKRLVFSDSYQAGIEQSQAVFIAVGTPSGPDGTADLSYVENAARNIAACLTEYKVIINKSTVPVGTGKLVQKIIQKQLNFPVDFDVVSNPEFLREGTAVQDFMRPDRIVIGTDSSRAREIMRQIYLNFILSGVPWIECNLESAELLKYASNAFLATKIAFINQIANLCEAIGGDIQIVARGMGLDQRIGPQFLNPGPGYGGSCFPKDTHALVEIARANQECVSIVETVIQANESQKKRMVQKIQKMVGHLPGKILAVLGLAFKSNTDDMRDSPAIPIISELLASGAIIKAYDPAAMNEAQKIFNHSIQYCDNAYEAAVDAQALIIATEWDSFRSLDLQRLKAVMAAPVLIDLRNIYQVQEVIKAGFKYEGIGRGTIENQE
jgi:UDPglucose 6-dehydrogenase